MRGSGMQIFLAGATGVIGVRLLPLMLAEGHVVAAMTRTPEKVNELRAAGVTPVLCDLFDQKSLTAAVKDFRPDVIVHQVTSTTAGFPGLFVVSSGCVGRAADAGGASTTRRARPHDQAAEPRPDARAGGALREW